MFDSEDLCRRRVEAFYTIQQEFWKVAEISGHLEVMSIVAASSHPGASCLFGIVEGDDESIPGVSGTFDMIAG